MTLEIESNFSIYFNDASIDNGNRTILSDVNLSIEKGSFSYLIGKTGSGKSSLLKTLYGANKISSGIGIVAGYDLSRMTFASIPKLRRRLGIIFQDFNLLEDLTVEQNLAYILKATGWKRKEGIEERVNKTLESVNLDGLQKKFPHQISGGEQQRLVIARALVNLPELILADEPTGNLDPETAAEIIKLLEMLNRQFGTTILMATHDYQLLTQFPHDIIECLDGRVIKRDNIKI